MAVGARPSGIGELAAQALPGMPLVAGATLPLAFIALGLAAFAAGSLWIALEPALVLQPHLHPRVAALAHLWLPGFLLSASIGSLYQLMPVALGAPLHARAAALWLHFALHLLGLPPLVLAFARGHFEWVALGGGLLAAGAVILLVAVLGTFRAASRRDAAAWSFPLAAGWLALTVLVGLLLALNRRWPFLSLSSVDLLRAHAHLGVAGFFLTLLQGTAFQLVPMFTVGEVRRPRLVWAGLLGTQAGLAVLAPGLAWHQAAPMLAGAGLLAAGLAGSGIALVATLRTRRKPALDIGLKAFMTGAAAFVPAAAVGGWLALAPPDHPAMLRTISAYGLLLIPGALSLTVLGMLCKVIPFLVWMRAYGPRVGRYPVPAATALTSRRLERAWFATHLAGLVLITAGCALDSALAARLGGLVLAVATGLFLANALGVFAHLRRPRLPAGTGQPLATRSP